MDGIGFLENGVQLIIQPCRAPCLALQFQFRAKVTQLKCAEIPAIGFATVGGYPKGLPVAVRCLRLHSLELRLLFHFLQNSDQCTRYSILPKNPPNHRLPLVYHCLEHVYPRLSPGGVCVMQSYCDPAVRNQQAAYHRPGVKQAADEFFRGVK